jgi:hypothetical protein
MLTAGQFFRLKTDIVAIEAFEDRLRAVVIPPGKTLRVTRFPCAADDRMADVLWDERALVVFGRDLRIRAEQIKSMSASW